MITAHSGCNGTADNSREYLLHAMELPVDAFEVDVRRDAGGALFLSHDPASEAVVFLADAFEMLHGHPEKKINCDLKQSGLERDVVELAQKYGVENQLIFTGRVNPELFVKGKAVFPQVLWFANLEVFRPEAEKRIEEGMEEEAAREALQQVLLEMKGYEAAGINWSFEIAERIWERAKELGTGISVWTVNEERDLKIWLERDVENITSRNIAGLFGCKNEKSQEGVK